MSDLDLTIARDGKNSQIFQLYAAQRHDECIDLIEQVLVDSGGAAAYALHVKSLILRSQGKISEALALAQQVLFLTPHDVRNIKEVGKCYYLLGKHRLAIDVYNQAQKMGFDDWELCHSKGLCLFQLGDMTEALKSFKRANILQKHDSNFIMMGQVYTNLQNYDEALQVYLEALEFSPENPEILTMVGLMYLRLGETYKAFDFLGNALTHNPRDAKTILAAGSIIQDNQDVDVALVKYRIAAQVTPRSPELWNNIGMCFFGKRKYVACVACLKKAFFIDPFQWIICFNLGLVHLCMEQYASAFHYLNATINLKPDWPQSYCFLGVALNRLDDFSNACAAYERAIQLDGNDHVTRLNFAIMLCNRGKTEAAIQQWRVFDSLWQHVQADEADSDVSAAANALKKELKI